MSTWHHHQWTPGVQIHKETLLILSMLIHAQWTSKDSQQTPADFYNTTLKANESKHHPTEMPTSFVNASDMDGSHA